MRGDPRQSAQGGTRENAVLRRLGVLLLAVAVSGVIAQAPAAAGTADDWRGDQVLRGRSGDRLALPGPAPSSRPRGSSAGAVAQFRYALSYVVIPVKGMRLGFSKSKVRAMTRRVAARTANQTAGRISYGFAAYRKAPEVRGSGLPCDLDLVNERFRQYAEFRRQPPPGFRDTVVVYVTPIRLACPFAGVAYLGGSRVYLNGLTLNDPQRLQDWITAHELGHTLGLDHAASFWLRIGDWSPGRLIPASTSGQEYSEYGDYLDVMGQPPRGGFRLAGARFGSWLMDGLDLMQLGVLGASNAPTIRHTGTYRINRLSSQRSGGRMMLAIPVLANGSRTFWVLEYRPLASNAALRYPAPWDTRAYGVRLLLAGHGRRYSTVLNKVFHRTDLETSHGALPVGTSVKLGGGTVVRVNSLDATGASVTVTLP